MGNPFLTGTVGIQDNTGARVDTPDAQGNYAPIVLKLGATMRATSVVRDGALAIVTLDATSAAASSIALANYAAFRALSVGSLVDGLVITFQSTGETFVYSTSLGAGQADDGLPNSDAFGTVLRNTAISIGSNGRAYNVNGAVLPSIAALRLAVSGRQSTVQVQAFATAGDGGGGTFVKVAGGTTDNGGTIIQPSGASFHYARVTAHHEAHPPWFGAKSDGTTNDAAAITAMLAALGDTTKLRSGRSQFPNAPTAISSTIAVTAKSGILEGAGPGPVSAGGSALVWKGAAGQPMIQASQSFALAVKDINLTCLDAAIKPSAGIDFHVGIGENFSNTNFTVENISVGAMNGDTAAMAPLMIKNPTSTSPDINILTTLAFPIGLFLWVTTGGARGTAKVKIATQGYSLDPTSTTWIDASGNPVNFASAFEFTTAATVNLPAAVNGHTYSFSCATGTYVVGNTYRQDSNSADNGIITTGSGQNDQFEFHNVVVQGVKDVGFDLRDGQNTTARMPGCKFNALRIGIQTKSRILRIEGPFFSTVFGTCVRALNDAGFTMVGFGAEGCAMLADVDGGTLFLQDGYAQPNARFLPPDDVFIRINGLDDTNSNVIVRLSQLNLQSDGTLGGRVAKVQVKGCKTALVVVDDVGFEGGETIDQFVAHFDMATIQSGQTRTLIFNFRNQWYKKFWNHGDAAPQIAALGWQEELELFLASGIGAFSFDSGGTKRQLIKLVASGPFANYVQLGDTSTPILLPQDVRVANAGQDLVGWRTLVGSPSNDCSLQAGSGGGQRAKLKDGTGATVLAVLESLIEAYVAAFTFQPTVAFPTIGQADPTNAAGTGMTVKAQNANGGNRNGGLLALGGGNRTGTGLAGGPSLLLGTDELLRVLEVATGRRVVSRLALSTTATEMPASTGDVVAYVGNAVTNPSANPVSGYIEYASGGAPFRRHADGTVD